MTPSKSKIQNPKFSFPRYPRYKDSGFEWLGDVPEHWEVEKGLRYLFETEDRSVKGDEELLSVSHLTGITPRSEKNITMFMAESYEGSKLCDVGDIAINTMWAWMSALGVSKYRGLVSPSYGTYRQRKPERFNPTFLDHLIRTDVYRSHYTVNSTGITTSRLRLYPHSFLRLKFICPPRAEQDCIVAFLDQKTAEIDALIAKKQRQIELLDEQKAILINRAVTSGLNPNVKLKPSGIKWIGKIPEHWEVKRIGHLGIVGNGSTPSRSNPRYWDRVDYPWLNSGSVNQGVITEADQFVSNLALKECHLPLVKENSIVIAITGQGKTRGTAALLTIPATINQHLAYIEIQTPAALPKFIHLALTSQYLQLRAISESGSTKGALTCQDVKEFKIVLPPIEEQKAIISASDKLQKDYALLASQFDSQIASLKTLRSTLIAHAVTGRIKV